MMGSVKEMDIRCRNAQRHGPECGCEECEKEYDAEYQRALGGKGN
jgi:hypothetical protein